jgi:hypothetical protein
VEQVKGSVSKGHQECPPALDELPSSFLTMPTARSKKKKTARSGKQLARNTSAKSVQEPQQDQPFPNFLAVAGIAANLLAPFKDEAEAIRAAYREALIKSPFSKFG